jgi:hypothetical protein
MNARELRLAIAFAAILVIGGGWLLFMQIGRWKKNIEQREFALSLKKVEADELLLQKDFWNTRSNWLSEKQPVFTSRKDADNTLYDLIEVSAKKAGITLLSRQQEQPEDQPGVIAAGIVVEAKGGLEKMLRWLHELQRPEAFISVKGMTLKPDVEDSATILLTEARIQKWYRRPATAAAP